MKKAIVIGVIAVVIIGVILAFVLGGKADPIVIADDVLSNTISETIIGYNVGQFMENEVRAEGHIILGKQQKGKALHVYALTMYGEYSFQDYCLVKVKGTEVVPALVKITQNDEGEFFAEIEWPKEGKKYEKSVKKLIPEIYQERALNITQSDTEELKKQEQYYAEKYLKEIKRKAEVVDFEDLEHKMLTTLGVSEEANKVVEEKYTQYPYWIGNKEIVEGETRFVYETAYNVKRDKVVLTKYKYKEKDILERIILDGQTGEVNN